MKTTVFIFVKQACSTNSIIKTRIFTNFSIMLRSPIRVVDPEEGNLLMYFSPSVISKCLFGYQDFLCEKNFIRHVNMVEKNEDYTKYIWTGKYEKMAVYHNPEGSFVFENTMSLKQQCIAKILECIFKKYGNLYIY